MIAAADSSVTSAGTVLTAPRRARKRRRCVRRGGGREREPQAANAHARRSHRTFATGRAPMLGSRLMSADALRYQIGFGNELATEALAGALPVGQSNPQKPRYGLYTEEINGTPFTAPRAQCRRTWTYRIRTSAVHKPF